MTTPAAVAVIRAALEDATTAELISRPRAAAVRVARALEAAGWTITPTPGEIADETPAQPFVTNR